MPPIHNHYVPAYYLSGFTNPATGLIYMYFKSGKKEVASSVQSVANRLHYWSNQTEQYLADEVENPANPVLDKIRRLEPITVEEKWQMSRYIITMLKRVPEGRNFVLSRFPAAAQETIVQLRSAIASQRDIDPTRTDDLLRQIDNLPDEFFDRASENTWEEIISPEATRRTVEALHCMKWVFLISSTGHGFMTSDNPVVYTKAKGIKAPEGELIFPISNRVSLWANWDDGSRERYVSAPEEYISLCNYWIVYSATDYLFYPGRKNWIEALIKRVVRQQSKPSGSMQPR